MTIREMHYDFKQKLNKIDSQQFRNLRVPEIDWKINEAYELFVKSVAQPRVKNHLGFEVNQRAIDDIRTIVINDFLITPVEIDSKTYYAELPSNYMFYVSSEVLMSKEACENRIGRVVVRQHDDRFEASPFDSSSFEWKEVNVIFYDKGIKIFTDSTFNIEHLKLNYIRKHDYIHNAQDFLPTGSYTLPSEVALTGRQDCELPEHTHREIVDIAVLITSGGDYSLKETKTTLNQLN